MQKESVRGVIHEKERLAGFVRFLHTAEVPVCISVRLDS